MFHDTKDPFEAAERLIEEAARHWVDSDKSFSDFIAGLPEVIVLTLRLLLSDYDRPAMRERSRALACRLLAATLPKVETFAQRTLEERLNADKKKPNKRKRTTDKLNA